MVELQSCAGLVNDSALCAIEQEVKAEVSVNVIAEISAELQKEREKNAQLMERISLLEAQIQQRDHLHHHHHHQSLLTNGQEEPDVYFHNQKKSAPTAGRGLPTIIAVL